MFFWPSDRPGPPRPEDVLRRRPFSGPYWESTSYGKDVALANFQARWEREESNKRQLEEDLLLSDGLSAITEGLNQWESGFVESVARRVKNGRTLSGPMRVKAEGILKAKGS